MFNVRLENLTPEAMESLLRLFFLSDPEDTGEGPVDWSSWGRLCEAYSSSVGSEKGNAFMDTLVAEADADLLSCPDKVY